MRGLRYVERKHVGALNEQIVGFRQILDKCLIAETAVVVVQLEVQIGLHVVFADRHYQFAAHVCARQRRGHGYRLLVIADKFPAAFRGRIIEVARGVARFIGEIFALIVEKYVACACYFGACCFVAEFRKLYTVVCCPADGEAQSFILQYPRSRFV